MIETTRDRLATVSKRIEILEAEANKKFQDAGILRSLHTKLCAEIIAEERLLAGKWVHMPNEYVIRLEAAGDLDDFPKVQELLSPMHNHEEYSLWQNRIALRFDDGVVSLWLPHETAMQFIRDNGIVIDLDNLVKNRDDLAAKLTTANELLSNMKSLQT